MDDNVRNDPSAGNRFDYVIAGGGLAGGLVALALAALRPRVSVALVERESRLGGNHTWSFHDGDLPAEAQPWIEPLVSHRWSGHSVLFPDGERHFGGGYASITSARFDRVARARLEAAGIVVRFGDGVAAVGPGFVRTSAGCELRAAVVLDGRGLPADDARAVADDAPPAARSSATCGYQRFLGLEVELAQDAPLDGPLLMDATVAQLDGFRFVYLLPFGPRHWLVEDTTYADTPALDRPLLRERVLDYLRARGHRVVAVVREEAGVLPLPFCSPALPDRFARAAAGSPLAIGYRGGWFHPLTGYSFPVAVRLALAIARADGPGDVVAAVDGAWRDHVRRARFSHWLTRMMFGAVAPAQRWRLLARFYRLPAPTIERFNALRMTPADRLRLVLGWPPRWLSPRPAAARAAQPLEEVS